jgi:hypothetical protein
VPIETGVRVKLAAAIAAVLSVVVPASAQAQGSTAVSIEGTDFFLNGAVTYPDTSAEGLLLNSRMVKAVFDDENPATRDLWAYPDTGEWDPERNAAEFVAALPSYAEHGLRAVTINLQGGRPVDLAHPLANKQPWHVSAFASDGSLKPAWLERLRLVLDAADANRIVVILGLFYYAQDQRLASEEAVKRGVDEIVDWLVTNGYTNVMVEIANESTAASDRFQHPILRPARIAELITRVKERSGGRLLASTSFGPGAIPPDLVLAASDFVLLHGNNRTPTEIRAMVAQVRGKSAYRADPKPIVFNEDSPSLANFEAALDVGASWGFFHRGSNNYRDGFQAPPVNWTINTDRKQAFFSRVADFAPPGLAFAPTELALTAEEGGTAALGSGRLSASGDAAVPYTLAADADWLVAAPLEGETPADVTVEADPTGLAPGTYTGKVTAAADGHESGTLVVTFTVTASPVPALAFAPATLSLEAEVNGEPASALVTLTADGTALFVAAADASWLSVSPSSGETPAELTVTADPTGLAVGTYEATVTATAEGYEAITLAVVLTVTAPPLPALVFSPAAVELAGEQNGTAAGALVRLEAEGAAAFTVTEDAAWLTIGPGTGETPTELALTADPAGLAPGTYTAEATATAEGYEPATLPVTFTVAGTGSPHSLLVSASPTRSDPRPLEAASVTGKIYVFVATEADVRRVRFFLDDPNMTRRPLKVEWRAPFDLAGTNHDRQRTAKPFSASRLAVGEHALTAAVELRDGRTEVITTRFTVAASG